MTNEKGSSIHPYEPFIPKDATRLIIGSIPPARFCANPRVLQEVDVDFYYGSYENAFWRIMADVSGINLSFMNSQDAVAQRKRLLESIGVGIMDIVKSCNRKGGSALDKDLSIVECFPLCQILKDHPTVDTLIYTSSYVKSQVNKCLKSWHSIDPQNPRLQSVMINSRQYKVVILYSPSPTALRGMGKGGAEKRMEQYKAIFKARVVD